MDKTGRGWNDPPKMPVGSVPPTTLTAKRSGISLNKRIAFPISGPVPASAGNAESANQTMMTPPKMPAMPPMMSVIPPLVPSKLTPCDADLPSLEVVSNNIDKFLTEQAHDIEHKTDIVKRLEDMKKMWREGLLEDLLCKKLFNISQALLDEDVDQALNLQVELLARWPSESSKWAAALRCLINHLRVSKLPSDVPNSEQTYEADQTTEGN